MALRYRKFPAAHRYYNNCCSTLFKYYYMSQIDQAHTLPLKPLHLPLEPGFWPLAWGYWSLLALITIALILSVVVQRKLRNKNRAKKAWEDLKEQSQEVKMAAASILAAEAAKVNVASLLPNPDQLAKDEEDYKKGGLVKRFQKGGVSEIDRDKLIKLMKEGSYDPTIANPNLGFK